MASVQTFSVKDLGGGVNDYDSSNDITDSEIQDSSRNTRGDARFSRQRKGYITFADLLTGSTSGIRNLSPYYRQQDSDDRLFMAYNNKIFVIEPTTDIVWTEIAQAFITSDIEFNTVSYYDWLFTFNGVDKPIRIEGVTATQPFIKPDSIASTNDFLPTFGVVYQNRLLVGGVPISPNSVFISKASTTAQQDFIYDFSGTIATGTADANEIVVDNRVIALRNLSTAAVIFTVDGAWYMSGFREIDNGVEPIREPIGGAAGAVSQKSTCVVENDVFYLTPNKEIRSVRRSLANSQNFTVTSLSKKVQRFLDNEIDDDLSTAFCYYDSKEQEVYFHFRKKGDALNTIRLVGNMRKIDENGVPEWHIDDGMPFFSGCFYKGQRYNGSSVLGQVYQDGVGNADDDDAPINYIRVSKEYVMNDPLTLKNWKGIHISGSISQSTNITASVYVDNVLVDERPINILSNLSNSLIAGIGTQETGSFEVGDESEDITPNIVDQYNFAVRIPTRKRGKSCTVIYRASDTNNEFKIETHNIFAVPISPFQYSISERQ